MDGRRWSRLHSASFDAAQVHSAAEADSPGLHGQGRIEPQLQDHASRQSKSHSS